MKKRQKPVLMVTILAVLVATVVGFNVLQNPSKGDSPQTPPDQGDQKMLDTPRASGDSKTIASDAASKMAGGAPKGAPPTPKMPGAPGMPGMPKPSMLRASPTMTKPKPNDSATSAQWYSSEHVQSPSKG